MSEVSIPEFRKTKYFNPYLGGVLLGLVLLLAFFISGRGLGASGAIKSTIVAGVETLIEHIDLRKKEEKAKQAKEDKDKGKKT